QRHVNLVIWSSVHLVIWRGGTRDPRPDGRAVLQCGGARWPFATQTGRVSVCGTSTPDRSDSQPRATARWLDQSDRDSAYPRMASSESTRRSAEQAPAARNPDRRPPTKRTVGQGPDAWSDARELIGRQTSAAQTRA